MSNRPRKFIVEFDQADAPLIAEAFAIARTAARMSGHHDAAKRLEQYRGWVMQVIPAVAEIFDEPVWGDMITALKSGAGYVAEFTPSQEGRSSRDDEPNQKGEIHVTVDSASFKSIFYKTQRKHLKAVLAELERLSPIGCNEVARAAPEAVNGH